MDKIYIVMNYVEHDLKSLMETMKQPFLPGEVKTLMIQLLSGVRHLHDNWILHRDLKTSNLLLSHAGILKVSPARSCLVPRASCLGKQAVSAVSALTDHPVLVRWATLGWLGSMVHP